MQVQKRERQEVDLRQKGKCHHRVHDTTWHTSLKSVNKDIRVKQDEVHTFWSKQQCNLVVTLGTCGKINLEKANATA